MINCIALDDEPLALELLSNYCSRVDFLDLKRTFTGSVEASNYLKNFPVDLLLLDIYMPDISGLDFYRAYGDSRMVIFTTAYSEFGVEGFDLNAVDYLLKPFSFDRFERAVVKARDYSDYLSNSNNVNDQYLFVRSEYKLIKIALSDIQYIEGFDDYIRIFSGQKRAITSHMSMKAVCEKLPDNMFARVHRSYIVNFRNDLSYRKKTIQIGTTNIPVGQSFEENVKKIFGGRLEE